MAKSSEPKTFDAVTILGLAVAVAIFIFGNMQIAKKRETERVAFEKQQQEDEDRIRAKQAREAAEKAKTDVAPVTGNPGTPKTPGADEAKPKPKRIDATPDITVTADQLEIVFQSKGAAVKSARFPGVDVDPSKKDHKGLEVLTEIVEGKRTFGIPKLEIIPKSGAKVIVDGKAGSESLDENAWSVKDSGGFDAAGIRTIAYEFPLTGYTLTKTFTVFKDKRFIRCDVKLENGTDQDVEYYYELNGPQGILLDGPANDPKGGAGARVLVQAQLAARDAAAASGPNNAEPEVQVVSTDAAKVDSEEGRSVSRKENLWGAVKNRFFMATFVSLEPQQLVRIVASPIINKDLPDDKRFAEPNIAVMGRRALKSLNKNTAQSDPYALYLGPADDHNLDAAETEIKNLMPVPADYHFKLAIQFFEMFSWRWPRVDWIARQMMWVFEGLHKLFGNFGIAVVLMTLLIKICLHPLTRKTMVSMNKMQKLQPELAKIKKKYENATGKDAKYKEQMEQQEVMKKAGVNPAAGCLPMLVQAPVFSALYGIFNHAFNMRGAEFLWIKDLSQPDRLYQIASLQGSTSWIPSNINLLPILYIITSIAQTRMTPQTKSDDPQQEMNRKMMMFMPVFISLMFYSMPAGLVLYFVVSAVWGMSESWYIKKFIIKDRGTPAAALAAAKK